MSDMTKIDQDKARALSLEQFNSFKPLLTTFQKIVQDRIDELSTKGYSDDITNASVQMAVEAFIGLIAKSYGDEGAQMVLRRVQDLLRGVEL